MFAQNPVIIKPGYRLILFLELDPHGPCASTLRVLAPGKALTKALEAHTWDPSVKSLVNFPQVLATMSEKLDVTQKLDDAFLAQHKDVLDAIQRLRAKARARTEGYTFTASKPTPITAPTTNRAVSAAVSAAGVTQHLL